jgi:RNA polymerase sigma-70 factor (ECF subfamily)
VSHVAASSGDPAGALLDLYDSALPEVYGYLLARCSRAATAEDLTSETFVAAVESLRTSPPPILTVAWLIGIARHKLVDHWRRAQREERKLAAVAGEQSDTEDPWPALIDVERTRALLRRLAPQHRAALTLRYLDGLSVPEVAAHLDRTVHATEALLVRARGALRRLYDEEGRDDVD